MIRYAGSSPARCTGSVARASRCFRARGEAVEGAGASRRAPKFHPAPTSAAACYLAMLSRGFTETGRVPFSERHRRAALTRWLNSLALPAAAVVLLLSWTLTR